MYMLQLFDSNEADPIDARLLRDGMIRLGRDGQSDWPIADPDCAISRQHCEVAVAPDGLAVRSLGANGVFDDGSGERLPDGADVVLAAPFTLRMGRFRLVVGQAPHDDDVRDVARTLVMTPPLGTSTDVPSDWSDAAPSACVAYAEGSLLEAFCEGAGLDASLLGGDEPTEIMRRAGAAYRQMVLGLGDLMAERDRARSRYQLTRTTISGADNNPFKWAPTQRLAIDLLVGGASGFLSGPRAIQASFGDIKRHLVATFAGFQASLREAMDTFAPAPLATAATERKTMLKGIAAAQVEVVAERHADLARQLTDGVEGSLDRAFVAAYAAAEAKVGGR